MKGGEVVKRFRNGVPVVLATMWLVATPAFAKTQHAVSCTRIRESLAAGKNADEVAKEFKVTSARVNSCRTQTASAHSGRTATKSK
jgi:hypothetical protein